MHTERSLKAGFISCLIVISLACIGLQSVPLASAATPSETPTAAAAPAAPDAPGGIIIPIADGPTTPDTPNHTELPAVDASEAPTTKAESSTPLQTQPVKAVEKQTPSIAQTAPAPQSANPATRANALAKEALPAETENKAKTAIEEQLLSDLAADIKPVAQTTPAPLASPVPQTVQPTPTASAAAMDKHVKKVEVSLADDTTLQILNTDYLKEITTDINSNFHPSLSWTFWACVVSLVILGISFIVIVVTGAFKNMRISNKLYTSFGHLLVAAVILGSGSYYYLNHATGYADMSMHFTEIDMIGYEIAGAQANFLLHGLENKAYGEKRRGCPR